MNLEQAAVAFVVILGYCACAIGGIVLIAALADWAMGEKSPLRPTRGERNGIGRIAR